MSFFHTLQQRTEKDRLGLVTTPLVQAAVLGRVGRGQYLAFLAEAYHHVKHTVPLLMACGARLPERLEWLREAVGEYINEELGHQEWILNDIRAAAGDPQSVRQGNPSLATDVMVAYAYDTVLRRNPVGFFGMVHVLEGTSVALADSAARAIADKLNLPAKAFSYLTSHGSLDQEHVAFFEKLMNRITESQDQEAIVSTAQVMYRLYGDIFRTLPQEEASHAA
ncbi:MAG: iron-containing redox enzyme family protein [Chromatiales bacterium]|nr:iron-containing redox enzyme family protein [Chromatiales bacterium]